MNVSTTLRHLMLTTALALPCAAIAVPPAHAPAHGWRQKHDPTYAGYSGRNWQRDYGVRLGRCDRAEIGAVLGGVAGGAIGADVADDDDRLVAVVVGTVIGAAIGSEIGRRMDRTDRLRRSCPRTRQLRADGCMEQPFDEGELPADAALRRQGRHRRLPPLPLGRARQLRAERRPDHGLPGCRCRLAAGAGRSPHPPLKSRPGPGFP